MVSRSLRDARERVRTLQRAYVDVWAARLRELPR